jgi:hypothetical protein
MGEVVKLAANYGFPMVVAGFRFIWGNLHRNIQAEILVRQCIYPESNE